MSTGRRLPAFVSGVGVALMLLLSAAARPSVPQCEALVPMIEVKRCDNNRVTGIDREVDRAYRRAIAAAGDLDAVTGRGSPPRSSADSRPSSSQNRICWSGMVGESRRQAISSQ